MISILFVLFVALMNVGFGFVAAVCLGDGPSAPAFREFCREWLPFDLFDESDSGLDEALEAGVEDTSPSKNAPADDQSTGEAA